MKFVFKYINIFSFYILLFAVSLSAQNIPASRRVEWNIAGVQGGIPCQTTVYNFVTSFSGDNTGATDNSVKLANALSTTPANAVIYFPNGTYRFNNTVDVPSNKVLRGQSVTGTLLNFNLSGGNNCFNIQGTQTATSSTVTASLTKGGNTLTLANASGFNVGDDILMEQVNNATIADDPASWADNLRGQLFVITGKSGNTLTFDRTFTLDYNIADQITVYKVTLKKNIGFENLTIDRLDANLGTGNETILFEFTANCWMRCVRSLRTGRYHVYLLDSRNAEIRGCYFYESKDYGSGGNGYGVLCQDHVGECLIENNVFRKLRHALIVKEGASRNVYGYNYSREATWTSAGIPADISVHGHYPYYNLYESNIVQRVTITDAWGRSGPGNTLFRNRVEGTQDLWLQLNSDNQNLEANEIVGSGATINANYDGTIGGTIQVANKIGGTTDFIPGATVLNSYYLSAAPSFFGAMPWPAIGYGTTYNTNTIPAFQRWTIFQSSSNVSNLMDHCSCSVLPVEYLNLDIGNDNDYATLIWTTASEKDADYFNVERSYDGVNYEVVGSVKAKNPEGASYIYRDDEKSFVSIVYYRLAQYDLNGVVNYSKVLSFEVNLNSYLTIRNNPTDDEFSVVINSFTDSNLMLKVFDVNGKELESFSLDSGSTLTFGSAYSPGLYFLKTLSQENLSVIWLVKY